LGHYVPGTGIVHRLDARMKLLITTAFVFALFTVDGWLGLSLCALLFAGSYLLCGIPPRLMGRGLKPILILLIFTLLANAFTFGAAPLGEPLSAEELGLLLLPERIALIGDFGINPAGFLRGLYFAVRIVLLVSITALLTYTTSIIALSDALISIMRPLARLRVPVEDIATMFSIALRFIPVTAEEAEKIMVAQSARGAVFNQGGPIRRARAWVPVMIPLFVSLFRRADELACAMETRCYTGRGRSHLRVTILSATDLLIGISGAITLITLGILL
jgi:energy-coupling factor transport system permease protein